MVTAAINQKTIASWQESNNKPSRDITLPTAVCIVKAMVLPVVIYSCESWTIKKAEHQRIDACGARETSESPLDSKETKPVNLKGDQP